MQLLRAVGNTFRSRFGIAQCCKAHSESSQCPQPTEKQSRTTTGKTMKSHFMVLALGRKAQSSPTAQHQPRDTENKVGCQSLIPPFPSKPVMFLFLHSSSPKFSTCFSLLPCPYCLTMQPHDAEETLSTSTGDCSQLRVPGKTIFTGARTQMVIKYSLLLLCSARWEHCTR